MTVRATLHIVSLAALIVIGGQAAVAKGDGNASRFAEIDSDSNGQVTEAEMRAHAAARFAAADSIYRGTLPVRKQPKY